MLEVLTAAEMRQLFGTFSWRPNGSSAIEITDDWVQENIVRVFVPALQGVDTYGGKFSGSVAFHKRGAEQLQRAFADIEQAGLSELLLFWDGSFVPRRIRGGQSLSRHSWGTAFDINAKYNGLGVRPPDAGQKGSVRELVPFFEAHGFAWGGHWENRPDGMHFEIAKLMTYPGTGHERGPVLVVNDRWKEAVNITLRDGISFAPLTEMAKLIGDEATGGLYPVGQYLTANGYSVKWDADAKKVYAWRG